MLQYHVCEQVNKNTGKETLHTSRECMLKVCKFTNFIIHLLCKFFCVYTVYSRYDHLLNEWYYMRTFKDPHPSTHSTHTHTQVEDVTRTMNQITQHTDQIRHNHNKILSSVQNTEAKDETDELMNEVKRLSHRVHGNLKSKENTQ